MLSLLIVFVTSNPMPVMRQSGFSLIELLVAISLLSIVLLGGFFFFNMIQQGYLREAGYSNQVRAAKSSADALFVSFHDNTTFTAASMPDWPADDALTDDNESHFALASIWADNDWIDDNGSYYCRITALDDLTPSFTIDSACHDDQGVSTAVLEEGLINAMPSVILAGAQRACIITAVSTSGGNSAFTVADADCLSDAAGTDLRADATSGAGVIFPRFISRGARRASILTTSYFDHFGADHDGAGLYFGVEDIYRDTSSSQAEISSDRAADNFSAGWANIDDFNETDALAVINPRGLDGFSLMVEAVTTGTSIARDNAGTTAETPLYRGNLTLSALRTLLNSLHVNRPGENEVTLRFHLGAGDLVWRRDLKLTLE